MKKSQATIEYIFLIALVAAAVIAMLFYISRGFQGNIRKQADQLSANQFERGKTAVNNIETKHVTATTSSRIVTTSVYGDETAFKAKQEEIDGAFLEQRRLDRELNLANYNWEKAVEYEAQTRYKKQSSGIDILLGGLKKAFGLGDADTNEKPKTEQLSDLRTQLADNLTRNAELQKQLNEFPAGDAYAERKVALKKQIADNEKMQVTLQDMYDLLVVNPDYSASFDADGKDQARLNYLVPSNQDADATTSASVQAFYDMASNPPKEPPYDTKAQAKNNIEAKQKLRQKEAEANAGTPTPSTETKSDAQMQTEESSVYEAIKNNTAPPFLYDPKYTAILPAECSGFASDTTGKCSKLFNDKIKQLNLDLKANIELYKKLQEESDAIEGGLKNTKSDKNYNSDTGTITIRKTINESLGAL